MQTDKTKDNKKGYKSNVKAIGIKSIFSNNGDVVITSFGKGNKANIEYDSKSVEEPESDYDFEVSNKNIEIEKGMRKACATNPSYVEGDRQIGQDLIRAKSLLEKEYFGKEYPNDNIRIQIIHNIQDIKKILSLYINNIVNIFKNVQRYGVKDNEIEVMEQNLKAKEYDLVGLNKFDKSYAETVNSFIEKNKGNDKLIFDNALSGVRSHSFLFGNIFKNTYVETEDLSDEEKDTANNKAKNKDNIYNFQIIRILSLVRNFCYHSDNNKLYELDNENPRLEIMKFIDELANNRITQVNNVFLTKLDFNIRILARYKNIKVDVKSEEFKKLVFDYYNFAIRNDNRNVGFNLRTIREYVLEGSSYKGKDYDNIRSKLYLLIDYIIWDYYVNQSPNMAENIVRQLRKNQDITEKEKIYKKQAINLKFSIDNDIKNIVKILKEERDRVIQTNDDELDDKNEKYLCYQSELNRISRINYNFVKVIEIMCNFLEGKEINELVTSLINKFDNIASFIDVVNKLDGSVGFLDKYKMFDHSAEIVNELRLIKSVSNKKVEIKAEKYLVQDAILSLTNLTYDDIYKKDENGNYIKEDNHKVYTAKYKPIDDLLKSAKNKELKNFFYNSYIKSDRFLYIVKYTDPVHVRHIMRNENIVKFVLGRIDEKQINRYYENCIASNIMVDKDAKVSALAKALSKDINIKDINKKDKDGKETNKALLGLYLTVAYIFVKNMVNVNARYAIAWACYDRDSELFGKTNSCIDLTKYFIEDNRYNKHQKEFLNEDLNELTSINRFDELIKQYRDNCAHLKVITYMYKFVPDIKNITSYYDIYQYCAEQILLILKKDIVKGNEYLSVRKNLINEKQCYCTDLVKVLNMPFAYNLPRYKQLSIDGLFNSQDNKRLNKKENSIIN